ncbi:MAG: hypothetical protein KDE45_18105, partial [Caldilineaceae bacterium]|nr:hypothetical protein [Caldilineaceae bacterium]
MRLALAAILVLVAYGPLLAEFGANLWSRPYYQHFPYVLLAAGYLIWRAMHDRTAEPRTVPSALRGGL